jgi:hypothetical protein
MGRSWAEGTVKPDRRKSSFQEQKKNMTAALLFALSEEPKGVKISR